LDQRRIAVAGVSREDPDAANAIYRRLRADGYRVFAVNPSADEVEGDPAYPDLGAIEGGVDAVVVGTHPDVAPAIVQRCIDLGIQRVWLHQGIGNGSYSEDAVRLGREAGLTLIPGGCPMMFAEPVDVGHRCMRWLFGKVGRLPRAVG
ncbi:MAG: CoA-binding protein, partial [Gammaproteobacteria bacterium]|nr:CoA-binding protein [Gemmatimonadota bacterium]NIU78689.1 CoA-binding protein [Gammaproteobacteria bacterium]